MALIFILPFGPFIVTDDRNRRPLSHSWLLKRKRWSKTQPNYLSLESAQSVQSLSRVRLFVTPWTAERQASLSIINSRSLLRLMSIMMWCHPTILSHLQSLPASRSFPMNLFFASKYSSGQSIGASVSASVLPMKIQDWFPSGWTRWISLRSKGLSSVFSNTTVQKHQFFGTQLSLWSSSHIHTWLLEKP